ncbi:hypothetical protein Hamer_G020460 [Homarus americanus]|uniref:Uncharacterized protein n=1 Tax=Homarus americanus TaxID=6706 RepID=A0A8J5JBA3_HOMAM|nr:hypothetical protein Hamer_G020460 [Homarus americanus]
MKVLTAVWWFSVLVVEIMGEGQTTSHYESTSCPIQQYQRLINRSSFIVIGLVYHITSPSLSSNFTYDVNISVTSVLKPCSGNSTNWQHSLTYPEVDSMDQVDGDVSSDDEVMTQQQPLHLKDQTKYLLFLKGNTTDNSIILRAFKKSSEKFQGISACLTSE